MAFNKNPNSPIMQAMSSRAKNTSMKSAKKSDALEPEDVADRKKGKYNAKEEAAEEKAKKS